MTTSPTAAPPPPQRSNATTPETRRGDTMHDTAAPPPRAFAAHDLAAPPHPFRASPWYDPRVIASMDTAPEPLRRSRSRVALVILGGVVMPIISVLVNAGVRIIDLGAPGVVLVLASALVPLAHLLWIPLRRRRGERASHVSAPTSTLATVALLLSAILSAILWTYLGVLFLPLLPFSAIGILFLGIGLCGLTPYFALAIALVEIVRATRILATRLHRRHLITIMTATLALPLILATAARFRAQRKIQRIERTLVAIEKSPPFSLARMRAIASLEGDEAEFPRILATTATLERRRTLAEVYLRLTDEPLTPRGWHRRGWVSQKLGVIHPWWFIENRAPFHLSLFDRHHSLFF